MSRVVSRDPSPATDCAAAEVTYAPRKPSETARRPSARVGSAKRSGKSRKADEVGPRPYAGPRPDAGRAAAYLRLLDEIEQHERAGRDVPCRAMPHLPWTSDEDDEQRQAAWHCAACPVLMLCSAYVAEHPEPSGAWAGATSEDRLRPSGSAKRWRLFALRNGKPRKRPKRRKRGR